MFKSPLFKSLFSKPAFLKKDPAGKLRKTYQAKMEAAMHAMRNGDVRKNTVLVAEAEQIKAEIDLLEVSPPQKP